MEATQTHLQDHVAPRQHVLPGSEAFYVRVQVQPAQLVQQHQPQQVCMQAGAGALGAQAALHRVKIFAPTGTARRLGLSLAGLGMQAETQCAGRLCRKRGGRVPAGSCAGRQAGSQAQVYPAAHALASSPSRQRGPQRSARPPTPPLPAPPHPAHPTSSPAGRPCLDRRLASRDNAPAQSPPQRLPPTPCRGERSAPGAFLPGWRARLRSGQSLCAEAQHSRCVWGTPGPRPITHLTSQPASWP